MLAVLKHASKVLSHRLLAICLNTTKC